MRVAGAIRQAEVAFRDRSEEGIRESGLEEANCRTLESIE